MQEPMGFLPIGLNAFMFAKDPEMNMVLVTRYEIIASQVRLKPFTAVNAFRAL